MLPTLCALSVAALAFLPSPPIPDVIPDGYRSVRVERSAELGPLRDHCCVQYVVEKGDILSEIAQTRLGSAGRWKEIVEVNADLDPERLTVGQRIWLPPRAAQGDAPLRYAYFSDFRGVMHARPLAASDTVYGRYGEFAFALVPADLRKGFAAAQEAGFEEAEAFVKENRIETFGGTSTGRNVPDASPIARVTEVVKVLRNEAGRFYVETEVVEYDRDGKPLGEDAKKGGSGGEAALFVLLAAAGAGLVWWRVRASHGVTVGERPVTA